MAGITQSGRAGVEEQDSSATALSAESGLDPTIRYRENRLGLGGLAVIRWGHFGWGIFHYRKTNCPHRSGPKRLCGAGCGTRNHWIGKGWSRFRSA